MFSFYATDVIASQLDTFLMRWQDQAHDGVTILSSAALKEIANLRIHIQRGCLSGELHFSTHHVC